MEAGGFEPPSRDASGQATTCLVAYLFFAFLNARRQALSSAIAEYNLFPPARTTFGSSLLS